MFPPSRNDQQYPGREVVIHLLKLDLLHQQTAALAQTSGHTHDHDGTVYHNGNISREPSYPDILILLNVEKEEVSVVEQAGCV